MSPVARLTRAAISAAPSLRPKLAGAVSSYRPALQSLRPALTRRAPPARAAAFYSTGQGSSGYEYIKLSTPQEGVGLVTLHRPKALNALCTPLFIELNDAIKSLEADKSVGAIVITGSEKAFAAGADIKEMKDLTFSEAYGNDFIELWSTTIMASKKPIIAAVNGYALGGGCELAMLADVLYCSKSATFGQPEVKLGVIPGAGGSQRLTHAIGKARAMDLILTGDTFSGAQAAEWGLAARVFDTPQECVDGAVKSAAKIASYSQIAVKACKEVVNKSQDLALRDGIEFERRVFHGLFGSKDQKIGMAAFAAKEKAKWTHQ